MRMCSFLIFALLWTSTSSASPLKICLTGATEKAIPTYGEAFENGARLAIEEYKTQVQIVVSFHEATPLAPQEKLRELQKMGCHAVVGFSTGNDLLAVAPALRENPMLTVSIYGDPHASFADIPYLLTMQPAADFLLPDLVQKLRNKLKGKKHFTLIRAIDRSEMLDYETAFKKLLATEGTTFETIDVIEQTQDLTAFKKRKDQLPKDSVLVILTRSKLAAAIIDALTPERIQNSLILGTKYFGSSELPALLDFLKNKDITAYISRQNSSTDSSATIQAFRSRYQQIYGKAPMLISLEAFEAVKFIALARELETPSPVSVIEFLKRKASFIGVGSSAFTLGLKVIPKKSFVYEITKDGYREYRP